MPPTIDPLQLTTGSIAALLGATIDGRDDLALTGLAGIERAGPGSLTFIRSREYAAHWAKSQASAALVTKGIEPAGHDPTTRALIFVPSADDALSRLLELLSTPPSVEPGVQAGAFVHDSAKVVGASIGPGCVVEAGAHVGEGTVLRAGVFVGKDASIGARCTLFPGVVVLDRCVVGDRCILHPGVVIGSDGFGYITSPAGHAKIPHIGIVRIEDDVEIGSNSCVDRAKFGETFIGRGTKIDNLVQVAHNCRIGRGCIICGHVGLSGSVTIGDGAVLAGQVGVADNHRIGARAIVGAQSGVMTDVPEGEKYLGYPAGPAQAVMKSYALRLNLSEFVQRIRALEKRLAAMESSGSERSP